MVLALTGCKSEAAPGGADAATSQQAAAAATAPGTTANDPGRAPSRGFSDRIAWRTVDDARSQAAAAGSPMMVLVHASWCGRCKELAPAFAEDEVVKASEGLVMVNIDQDEHPESLTTFAPDGKYVPRVLFFGPDGALLDEIVNPRSPKFPHYYSFGAKRELVAAMRRAGTEARTPSR